MTGDDARDIAGRRIAGLDDATAQARARALASPLRLRILRLCLHEPRTNRELADELGMNPGSVLHHVRSLVDNGFLRAGEPRRGTRGSREIPYTATRESWRHPAGPEIGMLLVDTFLQEIDGLPPETLHGTRLGVKLNSDHRAEMLARFQEVFQHYSDLPADPDGEPLSLFFMEHPDLPRSERATARSRDDG
jgi:DNA-binding transcriptional ArsR family regulator